MDTEHEHERCPIQLQINPPLLKRIHTDYLRIVVERMDGTVQQSETAFQESQGEIKKLQEELDLVKEQYNKSQVDLKMAKRQWKQVAQELNKQRTSATAFHTVTDDYLKQQIGGLRYDIRCLAQSYFGKLQPQPWPVPYDIEWAIDMPDEYRQCPASSEIAASFIWRVLSEKIFWEYRWPTKGPGERLYHLERYLKPPESECMLPLLVL